MYKIKEFKTINSTNTWAKENIDNLDDKTIVLAEHQSEGHGRFLRKWISDSPENIYCSIVLKPTKKDYLCNFTQYMSVVLCECLEEYKTNPEIKWPNDVLVNKKKIAGILCETVKNKGVVLGIGINLNLEKEILQNISQPATALNIETGEKINKKKFLDKFLMAFFENYENFIEQGFLFFKNEYLKRINFLGKPVKISNSKNKEEFIAKNINNDGSLTVTKEGIEQVIFSGDIYI